MSKSVLYVLQFVFRVHSFLWHGLRYFYLWRSADVLDIETPIRDLRGQSILKEGFHVARAVEIENTFSYSTALLNC